MLVHALKAVQFENDQTQVLTTYVDTIVTTAILDAAKPI